MENLLLAVAAFLASFEAIQVTFNEKEKWTNSFN